MQALIVDDSRTTRLILKHILKQIGFEVSEAGDGKEALAALGRMGRPDLILVDWDMPVMDGCEFLQAIRSQHEYDSLPLMMITAHTDMESVARALAAGANEFVMKPFTEEVIREKLELLGIPAS
ncbi:MAG: response regulator [Terriglobia bacterium]